MQNNEEHKDCFTCKYRKSYYGISWCTRNPGKPAQLSSFPNEPKCYKRIDRKHNHTLKPTNQIKAKIKDLEDSGNPILLRGKCKGGCRYYITQLNFCTAFSEYCGTFECYYLL